MAKVFTTDNFETEVFKEGKETARFVGLTSKTELEAALQ